MAKATAKKNTAPKKQRPKYTKAVTQTEIDYIFNYAKNYLGDISKDTFKAAYQFRGLPIKERLAKSRQVITECVIQATTLPDIQFPIAVTTSESLLKEYATLDNQHYDQIEKLIQQISTYLSDGTRKRPLNVLMLAAPGAGKSHFIKQLALSMAKHRVKAVTFNMATMQSADDMAQPIDNLRNLKVDDQFPLLFLDEFDSDPARYAALLPLLWDGELQIGHRDLKLGKAVIVLAGSNPDLPKTMAHSGAMRLDSGGTAGEFQPTGKLVDLLSRINGGIIEIPDLDLQSQDRDRRVDKVCIAISLLKARFGKDIPEVSRSLLRFIAQTTFRYGVRSIAHLIDLIVIKKTNDSTPKRFSALSIAEEDLPMFTEKALEESSLRLHLLDKDRAFGIVNRWKECCKDKNMVSLADRLEILPFVRISR